MGVASPPSIYSSFLPSDLLSPVHHVAPLPDPERSQSQVRSNRGRGLATLLPFLTSWSVSLFFLSDGRRAVGPAHPFPLPLSVFFSESNPQPQPLLHP